LFSPAYSELSDVRPAAAEAAGFPFSAFRLGPARSGPILFVVEPGRKIAPLDFYIGFVDGQNMVACTV
jgi:hypothetical protein